MTFLRNGQFTGRYKSSRPSKSTISASLVLICARGCEKPPRFVPRRVRDCVLVTREVSLLLVVSNAEVCVCVDCVSVSCSSKSCSLKSFRGSPSEELPSIFSIFLEVPPTHNSGVTSRVYPEFLLEILFRGCMVVESLAVQNNDANWREQRYINNIVVLPLGK